MSLWWDIRMILILLRRLWLRLLLLLSIGLRRRAMIVISLVRLAVWL